LYPLSGFVIGSGSSNPLVLAFSVRDWKPKPLPKISSPVSPSPDPKLHGEAWLCCASIHVPVGDLLIAIRLNWPHLVSSIEFDRAPRRHGPPTDPKGTSAPFSTGPQSVFLGYSSIRFCWCVSSVLLDPLWLDYVGVGCFGLFFFGILTEEGEKLTPKLSASKEPLHL